MNIPSDLQYSKTHEWVKIQDDTAVIGITDYAQDQLGDVVFLEINEKGTPVEKETPAGSIESVKSVSELMAPLSGEIIEINEEAVQAPEKINSDPYDLWLFKLKMSDSSQTKDLLSPEEYESFVKEEQ